MFENKNIGIIGEYPPTMGGIATHVKGLANVLSKKNKIFLIAPNSKSYFKKEGNIEIYRTKRINRKHFTTLTTILPTTLKAFSLRKKVDLFHAHAIHFGLIKLICKRTPMVLTFHGRATTEAIRSGRIREDSYEFKLLRKLEKTIAKKSNAIISVGTKLKEWIIEELDIPEEKVFVIPNGIDTNLFDFSNENSQYIKKKHNLENSKIILFTKKFSQRYGTEHLIMAMENVIKIYPNTKLIMTGEDIHKEKIIKLAKEKGVINNIIFTGQIPYEDISKYYSACDVFVHPSIDERETFGIALIEAMACKKPVIATSVGGPKEILEGGEDIGILIPPRDTKALSEKIIYLLKNEKIANKIGENARKYVVKRFSWNEVVERISDVYQLVF